MRFFRPHRGLRAPLPDPDDLWTVWNDIFEELELDWTDEWDAEETAAPEFTRRTGLTLVGAGNGRVVFAYGPGRVLKLAYAHGEQDNRLECNRWVQSTPTDRRWLAPVLACGPDGEWLIMARAEPLTERQKEAVRRGRLEPVVQRLGLDDLRAPMNWGQIRGRMVAIDYGVDQP